MTTLDILPVELLTEILSELANADLFSTSLVSHRLHDLSMPLLYQAPVLRDAGCKTFRPLLKIFLWTILTPGREFLATHVRALTWRWDRNPSTRRCPSEDTILNPVALRLGVCPGLDSEDVTFLLLIHLLPHLRVLTLTPPVKYSIFTKLLGSHDISPTVTLPVNLEAASTVGPLLLSLHEFHSPAVRYYRGIGYRILIMVLMLPAISHVDVHLWDDSSLLPKETESVAASSVRKLRLARGGRVPRYLFRLLKVATVLTHFSYSTIRLRSTFTHKTLFMAMRPLRFSVVNLHLDIQLRLDDTHQSADAEYDGSWSLQEWSLLRTLSCSLVGLVARPRLVVAANLGLFLPASLRELEVREDHCWPYAMVVDEVVELLGQKMAAVPVLERVAVMPVAQVAAMPVDPQVLEKLSDACEAAGVTLVDISLRW